MRLVEYETQQAERPQAAADQLKIISTINIFYRISFQTKQKQDEMESRVSQLSLERTTGELYAVIGGSPVID